MLFVQRFGALLLLPGLNNPTTLSHRPGPASLGVRQRPLEPFRVLSQTSKDVLFIAVTAPSSLDQTLRLRETGGGRKGSGEIEGDRGRSWDLEIGGAIEGK